MFLLNSESESLFFHLLTLCPLFFLLLMLSYAGKGMEEIWGGGGGRGMTMVFLQVPKNALYLTPKK